MGREAGGRGAAVAGSQRIASRFATCSEAARTDPSTDCGGEREEGKQGQRWGFGLEELATRQCPRPRWGGAGLGGSPRSLLAALFAVRVRPQVSCQQAVAT